MKPYVEKQLVHVGVACHFPLVLGHFVHLTVEVKVQASQLLLHLPHVLHLADGALVTLTGEKNTHTQTHRRHQILKVLHESWGWSVRSPNYRKLAVFLSGSRWEGSAGRSPSPEHLTHQSGRSAGWQVLPEPGSGWLYRPDPGDAWIYPGRPCRRREQFTLTSRGTASHKATQNTILKGIFKGVRCVCSCGWVATSCSCPSGWSGSPCCGCSPDSVPRTKRSVSGQSRRSQPPCSRRRSSVSSSLASALP